MCGRPAASVPARVSTTREGSERAPGVAVRTVIVVSAFVALAGPAGAQSSEIPTGMAEMEMERSRRCVGILQRVEALDVQLRPLADRVQRILAIAEAVALEDERAMEELDRADPLELRVHEWFLRDQELGQRYATLLSDEVARQRTTAKREIEQVLSDALDEIQEEADGHMAASGDLAAEAGPCDGAIFVRSAVLEACASASGAICDAAANSGAARSAYRFVDSAEAVWDIQEMRPWTAPTPLRPTPNGQLDGARTIGYARAGNVVVTVAFSPLLRDRAETPPEELARFEAVNDSLGLEATHPDLVFAPALGLRATLPRPLAGETRYVLHFLDDPAGSAVWSADAGSGAAIETTLPLSAAHTNRLQAGEPLVLSAFDDAGDEALFAIELTAVNQARASAALLGYMSSQLDADLATYLRPRGAS